MIKEYLSFAFNDPAYYCPVLFSVVRGYRAVNHLKGVPSLFNGTLAAREKAVRESYKSAPQEL